MAQSSSIVLSLWVPRLILIACSDHSSKERDCCIVCCLLTQIFGAASCSANCHFYNRASISRATNCLLRSKLRNYVPPNQRESFKTTFFILLSFRVPRLLLKLLSLLSSLPRFYPALVSTLHVFPRPDNEIPSNISFPVAIEFEPLMASFAPLLALRLRTWHQSPLKLCGKSSECSSRVA